MGKIGVCISLMVLSGIVLVESAVAVEKVTTATVQVLYYEESYQLYMQAKWEEAIEHFDKALVCKIL